MLAIKKLSVKTLADKIVCNYCRLSGVINRVVFSKIDLIATAIKELNVSVSEICFFRGIEINPYFKDKEFLYKQAADVIGDVTYRPLRKFFEEHKDKTVDGFI